jgi:hypothetical protein
VACNPLNMFQAFVDQFDDVIGSAFRPDQKAAMAALEDREFAALAAPAWSLRLRWANRRVLEWCYRFFFATLLGRARPETREIVHSWLRYAGRPLRFALRQLRS